MAFTEFWMDTLLAGTTKNFTDICMPGSHDAAMSTEAMGSNHSGLIGKLKKNAAKTQKDPIFEQLKNGCRWFDIRMEGIHNSKDWLPSRVDGQWKRKEELKGGRGRHAAFKTNDLATGFGQSWFSILEDVKKFLLMSSGEFVCLRISKSDPSVWEFMRESTEILREAGMMLLGHESSIAKAEYSILRGKCLVFIDEDSGWNEGAERWNLRPRDGFYRFQGITKSKDHVDRTHPSILKGCGSFSDQKSFADVLGAEVMASTKLDEILEVVGANAGDSFSKPKIQSKSTGQAGYMAGHVTKKCGGESGNHIVFLYWTSTGSLHVKNATRDLNQGYNRPEKGTSSDATAATKDQLLGWGFEGSVAIENGIREFTEAFKGSSNGSELTMQPETLRLIEEILQQDQSSLQDFMPNVVMYDFINENQSLEIIGMNHGVNLGSLELFE